MKTDKDILWVLNLLTTREKLREERMGSDGEYAVSRERFEDLADIIVDTLLRNEKITLRIGDTSSMIIGKYTWYPSIGSTKTAGCREIKPENAPNFLALCERLKDISDEFDTIGSCYTIEMPYEHKPFEVGE